MRQNSVPTRLLFSFFPFSSLSRPFQENVSFCHLAAIPSVTPRAGARRREREQGAGPRTRRPSGSWPHSPPPHPSRLPGTPSSPSLSASPPLRPGSQLRAGGRDSGLAVLPGRADSGLGPTSLRCHLSPGPARPGPSSSAYISVCSRISALHFSPQRSRVGEDVTSSARHVSPGVPQDSPQAGSPPRAQHPLPPRSGAGDSQAAWRGRSGHCLSEKGVDRRGNGFGYTSYMKHSPNWNPIHRAAHKHSHPSPTHP